MVALAFAMLGCNKEKFANVDKVPVQEGKKLSFTATIAAPTETKTTYTEDGTSIRVTWKVNDQIALVHNGVKDVATVTAVDGSGKATIEADITGSPSDNDDVYLAYPADAVYYATPYSPFPFTPNPDIFEKVKNYQDGTLEYIQNYLDLRMGSGKLAVNGSDVTIKESVSVSSLICIWKLTLQDESSNALSATKLTFKNNTYTQAKATSAAKSVYYLCVVPSFIPDASGTFSFEATVGSDTYTFSKTGLSLTEGKYYQSTVKMKKVLSLTSPAVGQVIGSDGKNYAASASLPSGVTKVAMIAYVSGANGLAIALADESEKMDLETAKTTAAAHTPAFTGGTWKLPSKDDWTNMFNANGGNEGSYTGLNTAISTAGGTGLKSSDYWTSTEYYFPSMAYRVFIRNNGTVDWNSQMSIDELLVRAVLAF